MFSEEQLDKFCPDCGARLQTLYINDDFFFVLYRCPREEWNTYLEVIHPIDVFPLQPLNHGTADRILNASEDVLREAAEQIAYIDSKTVSLAEFERYLLGMHHRRKNRPSDSTRRLPPYIFTN